MRKTGVKPRRDHRAHFFLCDPQRRCLGSRLDRDLILHPFPHLLEADRIQQFSLPFASHTHEGSAFLPATLPAPIEHRGGPRCLTGLSSTVLHPSPSLPPGFLPLFASFPSPCPGLSLNASFVPFSHTVWGLSSLMVGMVLAWVTQP